MIEFWTWFFRGTSTEHHESFSPEGNVKEHGKAGVLKYFDKWLFLHLFTGLLLMLIVPVKLNDAAKSILFPLAGIFIGLTFAWGGNAVSLMQSEEINLLADHHPGGLKEYVYKFQSAILILLITIILWGFGGLNVFEFLYAHPRVAFFHNIIEALLYSLVSMSLRECWHVVIGAQTMVLYRRSIKKILDNERQSNRIE
ncbi:MAG: hypothetical protein PHG91_13465 [Syntrophales bacterium]|nr:hypothetical protein [Syntrophales bacterium]